MSYRVLIPTAGTGSRLGTLTKYVNKSLVGIANRPTISHIIEQFPLDVEFVVALGHKGHLVEEFLKMAYPYRTFYFEYVDPFEGPGSGLGLSVLKCKKHLQQPFVFISCDTLVQEEIPALDQNWMGYAEISDIEQYRTIEISSNRVIHIHEKGGGDHFTCKPYIGLAGIYDYQSFWTAMESNKEESIIIGESHGLRHLIASNVKSYCFTWFDTGNLEALELTRKKYKEPNEPNILEKANEAIWFIDDLVIKFSDDKRFIENRVKRAQEIENFVPEVTGSTPNMYSYKKVKGEVLSSAITLPLFERLLQHSKCFWEPHKLAPAKQSKFQQDCIRFYKDKTEDRIALFYRNFDRKDGNEKINGADVPELKSLLSKIDWNWLANGLPGRFHGDYHFENIIYAQDKKQFVFLDWRQEFGGSLKTGDIYYDFAKLLHGLIISHELISENHFWINWQTDEISYDFHRKQILVECENYFALWLLKNGYDRKKVWVLTAIVYLNIAALHHYPYGLLLYALGKSMLNNILNEKQ